MKLDIEQATEHSHLLPHAINDRRLSDVLNERRRSSVQQDAETRSILSSHVSKAEQALASTPVGERLPYNDYTTIDWLHDLVRPLLRSQSDVLTTIRSRTPSDFGPFTLEKVYGIASTLPLTRAKGGSHPPSSVSSLQVSLLWSMSRKLPSVTGRLGTVPRTSSLIEPAVARAVSLWAHRKSSATIARHGTRGVRITQELLVSMWHSPWPLEL